jgi:acetyl-CoA carboxylase biotin carboxyl carrier protein
LESFVPDEPAKSAAKSPAKAPAPFDVRTVEALVALMTEHDLSEIDLRDGIQRLRLRRGAAPAVITGATPQFVSPPTMAPPSAAPASNNQAAAAPTSAKKLIDIKSPSVGTFYAAPNPEAEPFVKIGSKVTPNSVVGMFEAMKLFNEIPAECTGTIVEILIENQQSVEFGQVLMRVDPAG